METVLDHPHIFMTRAYGSLCNLQFNICHRVSVHPEIFWLVLVKGTATQTPLSR